MWDMYICTELSPFTNISLYLPQCNWNINPGTKARLLHSFQSMPVFTWSHRFLLLFVCSGFLLNRSFLLDYWFILLLVIWDCLMVFGWHIAIPVAFIGDKPQWFLHSFDCQKNWIKRLLWFWSHFILLLFLSLSVCELCLSIPCHFWVCSVQPTTLLF